MLTHLFISVICDDKPGVIEAIAEAVREAEGNWLESKLSQLGGKFAGVIKVAVPDTAKEALAEHLHSLEHQGIHAKLDSAATASASDSRSRRAFIHVLGPDRPGIVKEFASALAIESINVSALETNLSSMPYSGDPLFEAQGELQIPEAVDLHSVHQTLNVIADALALDISLSDTPFPSEETA